MKKVNRDFIDALQYASEALMDAIPGIDELNGRLEELDHYGSDYDKLDEHDQSALDDARRMYEDLPVWDTIETLASNLQTIAEELEAKADEQDAETGGDSE